MIELRSAKSLGTADYGWLKTRYHFSFADYHDAERIQWGHLRVWNDDQLAPHSGFPANLLENIELITYIYQGAITYSDNLGHDKRIETGHFHIISAGSGIEHRIFNNEPLPTHLFQIWIIPEKRQTFPTCHTFPFPNSLHASNPSFSLLASGFPEDNAPLPLNVRARLTAISLCQKQSAHYIFDTPRQAYLVATKGEFTLNGQIIHAFDGVAIDDEKCLNFSALTDCEIILLDLA